MAPVTTTLATLLRKRLKLTEGRQKIANRSKQGWRVVVQYKADDLAPSCRDEKHLEKANKEFERRANMKAAAGVSSQTVSIHVPLV